MGGNRRPKPEFGKLKTGRSRKPEKTTKSDSSEDDSDDGNDDDKWKEEEGESFRDKAAAREAFLQKQVDSLKQELVEKEYSASSLSSGSNASKCIVALKLTDAHKSQMKSFRDTHGWSSCLLYTSDAADDYSV